MNSESPKKLAIIGCGTISGAYFKATKMFPRLEPR